MNLDDIVQAFESTPPVLRRLLVGCTDQQLRARTQENNWSIIEVLAHIRDAEEFALLRDTRMAREDNPFIPAYDQNKLVVERDYPSTDPNAALAAFERLRVEHLALIRSLQPSDLDRPGTHEESGPLTMRLHIEHMISHDINHLAQIARALE